MKTLQESINEALIKKAKISGSNGYTFTSDGVTYYVSVSHVPMYINGQEEQLAYVSSVFAGTPRKKVMLKFSELNDDVLSSILDALGKYITTDNITLVAAKHVYMRVETDSERGAKAFSDAVKNTSKVFKVVPDATERDNQVMLRKS